MSLSLNAGSFLIVIGTNGSGKSTLLNAVAGTFFVDTGNISIAGQTITRWPEHAAHASSVAFFRTPSAAPRPPCPSPRTSSSPPVAAAARGLGLAVNRRSMEELRARIRPLNMGLEDRLENPIGSLSGGQRQALTLLMASWLKPELLLLDEHTAALDPKTADQVIRLTHEIIERDKLTTLMVTHSMQQAVNLGDRIVMMHKGNIIHDLEGSERARVRPKTFSQDSKTSAAASNSTAPSPRCSAAITSKPRCIKHLITLVFPRRIARHQRAQPSRLNCSLSLCFNSSSIGDILRRCRKRVIGLDSFRSQAEALSRSALSTAGADVRLRCLQEERNLASPGSQLLNQRPTHIGVARLVFVRD